MIDDPTRMIDDPTWMIDDPTWMIDDPARMIDDPARMIDDPAWMIDDPARMIDDPTWMIDDPTWMIDHPAPTPANSGMTDGRKCRKTITARHLSAPYLLSYFLSASVRRMDAKREDAAAEYERHFDALSRLAEDLKVPAGEAEELIDDILMSTLFKRNIPDLDTWLAAAFTMAAKHREARAC